VRELRGLVDRALGIAHSETKAPSGGASIEDTPAAMRIRISDPELARDLLDYLGRNECVAIQTGRDIVAVSLSQPLPYYAARTALDLRLAEWLGRHAQVRAVVID
jgi:hypothetical protein